MRKIGIIILAVMMIWVLPISMNSCSTISQRVNASTVDPGTTYLICGFDDAAGNTDVIILLNYSKTSNRVSILQIPRDTYFEFNNQRKINSIYPSMIASGADGNASIASLSSLLGDALGINIDEYIGIKTDSLVMLVDSLGGVEINLTQPMDIKDANGNIILSLQNGKNNIDGKEALMFVRSRNGYATADLGRIDAQKVFLSALLSKMRSTGVRELTGALSILEKNSVHSLSFKDLLDVVLSSRKKSEDTTVKYASIPGKALQSASGEWYFSIDKASAAALLSKLGFVYISDFDKDKVFLNENDKNFTEIYYSDKISYRIYDEKSLSEISIK